MDEITPFLIRHGELLVFVTVFAEQAGLPIPAFPVLLAAGALAGAGKLNLAVATVLAVMASLLGGLIWYCLGRYRGAKVLKLLCQIALEPDSCARQTETFFLRHGTRSLIMAKFIPGLSTVTPAMAGLFGTPLKRFLLYTGLGGLLWSLAAIAPGYLFSDQLEQMAIHAGRLGSSVGLVIVGAFALFLAYKYIQRHRLLSSLRMARISPDELKAMLDTGMDTIIVDLRGPLDLASDPYEIPGALRMTVEELAHRQKDIPRDRDVILFCACPDEAAAARMALLLRKNGITRVRPLAGGIEAWRARNYPVLELGEQMVS